MRRSTSWIVAIIIIAILIIGGYAIFHKSSKSTNTSTTTTTSSNKPAVNNAVVVTKTDSKLGQYLADPSGKPLYTYDKDTSGVSNCTGTCLANWPAYVATGSTSNLPGGISTIKRTDDGKTQYTYNGMPLYYFVGDSAGKVTGNGQDSFTIAKPAAATTQSAPSTSTNTSTNSSSSSNSTKSTSGYSY